MRGLCAFCVFCMHRSPGHRSPGQSPKAAAARKASVFGREDSLSPLGRRQSTLPLGRRQSTAAARKASVFGRDDSLSPLGRRQSTAPLGRRQSTAPLMRRQSVSPARPDLTSGPQRRKSTSAFTSALRRRASTAKDVLAHAVTVDSEALKQPTVTFGESPSKGLKKRTLSWKKQLATTLSEVQNAC